MKKIILVFTIAVAIVFTQVKLNGPKKEYITIFMAASTTDLVGELSKLYTSKTGIEVKLNPASSGVLAKQIISGAETDIYISASKKWVDYIADYTIEVDSFVTNSLVLISPINSDITFSVKQNLPSVFEGKFSMGDPSHVPAGVYAMEVLDFYGWKQELEPRILPASNARSALSVVEIGEIDLGIVYKTDALKSTKVKIVETFPEESHKKIEYYSGLLNKNKNSVSFYKFLLESEEANLLYKKYGFN